MVTLPISDKLVHMSETPKTAKIYEFSDAIDKNLDSKQAKLIAEAQDFSELKVALEKIDVIQGTQHLYTAEELADLIIQARAFAVTNPEDIDETEDYLLTLPRMFGLRDKVRSLLQLAK